MTSIVDQIKEKLDIVEVISSYIKVEKAGINWKAKCPFHNEKTPSFFISSNRQNFYCFGCHEKGDVISFVEKFEGLDFKGAIESLANKAGIEIKKSDYIKSIDNKDKLLAIMEESTLFFIENLQNNPEVKSYLQKRGLNEKSIKDWRLGFATDKWRSLLEYLSQKKYTKNDMIDAGLIKKVLNEEKYYDTFRDRTMFPIFDSAGRVIAFSGRTLKTDDKTPKYLNSPETKLFYKSEVLYGFNIAKDYIRKLDYTVIVEGQMDLLLSHQSGVHNTVATSGTAITELHLKKLQRLSNRIIIAFDSDNAGEKASHSAALIATSLGMEVKIAKLEEGEDPASIIKKDAQKWKDALRDAKYYSDYILEKTMALKNDRVQVKHLFEEVLPYASQIRSNIEKEKYVKKISTKLKVSEDNVWRDIEKITKNNLYEEKIDILKIDTKKNISNIEKIALGLILIQESNNNLKFPIRERISNILGEEKIDELINKYDGEKEKLIFEIETSIDTRKFDEICEEIINRIELDFLKEESRKLAVEMDENDLSNDRYEIIKDNFNRIQTRIRELQK